MVEALTRGLVAGRVFAPNDWLMTIAPAAGFEFLAAFDAAESAGRLVPGQPADIEFHALPWTEFGTLDAVVTRVGNEERDGRIEVALELDSTAPLFRHVAHGLQGRVTVATRSATLADKLLQLVATQRQPTRPDSTNPR